MRKIRLSIRHDGQHVMLCRACPIDEFNLDLHTGFDSNDRGHTMDLSKFIIIVIEEKSSFLIA
jgi:hypothetical protein